VERTIATIVTDSGIARLIHDDIEHTLMVKMPDEAAEYVSDYYPTASWRNARKQVIAMYGAGNAYHDSWVLCVRPTAALKHCTSED